MHIKDIVEVHETASEYPLAKEKYLIERAALGETSECIQTFHYIFDWLVQEYKDSIKDIQYRLAEIIVMFHRLAYDYGIEGSETFKRQNYLTEFLLIEDTATLKIWCRNRIDYITGSIKFIRMKRLSNIVTNAKVFINSNFNKDLTLEDVSKEVNLSPHYFSKFFKEETGENFIDYLTSLRIQKAKDFLESGQYSIKEVSYKVGYNDPNYFSRIFKKITGYTPTDYKF